MPTPLATYRLRPAARRDLSDIWDYTASEWSVDRADRYVRGIVAFLDALLEQPRIARERTEITPPVRLQPYASHLIVYRIEEPELDVIRIVHARQDWLALLRK